MNSTAAPELKRCDIVFDEFAHTYTLPDGTRLSGITSILHRRLFPDKYSGVDADTLHRAAERGSNIHQRIELHDSLGISDTAAAASDPLIVFYNAERSRMGVTTIANEYLVTDGVHVASAIDIVFSDFSLCDIKSTSRLDMEYLSWQLSVYAWLFELQNPGLRVPALWALWWPDPRYGKPRMVSVPRISADECRRLIEADAADLPFVPSVAVTATAANTLAPYRDAIDAVCHFEQQIKSLQAQRDALKTGLLEAMKAAGVSSWSAPDGSLTLTRRESFTRRTVDSKRLEADYPDVFADVTRESLTRESLVISVKS